MIPPHILFCTLPIVSPGTEYKYMDRTKAYRQPRLGVQAVRGYLIESGYPTESITFLDIDMLSPDDEELSQMLSAKAPDILALSAVLSHSYQQVKRVSQIARNILPEIWIVVGGHLTVSADVLLRKTEVDVCIVGDGEVPFKSFVDFVQEGGNRNDLGQLENTPGVCYLGGDGVLVFPGYATKPRNEIIAMPDYQFFESGLMDQKELIAQYFQPAQLMGSWFTFDSRFHDSRRKPNVAQVPTTKGCVARCTFCQRSTKGYRLVDLTNLERHLLEIIDKYDVGYIDVLDENFGSRRDHARAFADLMEKHNLLWTATGVRCTSVNWEDVIYFKEKGCCSLKFGVESGSQKILDVMEKNFSKKDVEDALTACWENHMYSPLALMVGMPGEGNETIQETGEWIGEMSYKLGIHPDRMQYALFYALPFPGTPLYEYCTQVGLLQTDIDSEEQYLINMANATTTKWCYVNVNGASPIDVLAWDYLVQWQAAKTFTTLSNDNPPLPSEFAIKWGSRDVERTQHSQHRKMTLNGLFSRYGIVSICEKLYTSRYIRILPRQLAYPTIRFSFFTAVAIYHLIGKLLGREVFMMYKDRPTTTPYSGINDPEKRLKRSLRAKVSSLRMEFKSKSPGRVKQNLETRAKLLKGAAG